MRVVIGEDEALLREGLVLVLQDAGIEVAAVTGDAGELVRLAREQQPEVLIADIRMPPSNSDDGLRAALEARRGKPGLGIVILSQHVNRRYASELLAGDSTGVGYLLKQRVADTASFCADVRRVAAGETVLDPEVVAVMLARAERDDHAVERLTARQREVLELIAQGHSNAAIARRLVITEKAVVQHISHIYQQLGLAASDDHHRRVLAVARYLAR